MENYSAIKGNEIWWLAGKWVELEITDYRWNPHSLVWTPWGRPYFRPKEATAKLSGLISCYFLPSLVSLNRPHAINIPRPWPAPFLCPGTPFAPSLLMQSYASLKTRCKCACHCLQVPLGMLCGPYALSVVICYARLSLPVQLWSRIPLTWCSVVHGEHCSCNLALASLCSKTSSSDEFRLDTQCTRQICFISEKQKTLSRHEGGPHQRDTICLCYLPHMLLLHHAM